MQYTMLGSEESLQKLAQTRVNVLIQLRDKLIAAYTAERDPVVALDIAGQVKAVEENLAQARIALSARATTEKGRAGTLEEATKGMARVTQLTQALSPDTVVSTGTNGARESTGGTKSNMGLIAGVAAAGIALFALSR